MVCVRVWLICVHVVLFICVYVVVLSYSLRKHSFGSMVQCETCLEWFHVECISYSLDEINAMDSFMCGQCIGMYCCCQRMVCHFIEYKRRCSR